jgi:hypothetical protein
MRCKICESESNKIFSALLLNKYNVSYYQCEVCEFIQTEEPYWLDEAYSSAIADLDTSYVKRNFDMSYITKHILKYFIGTKMKYLDYGGGYGLYVRIMRDNGFDFYLFDQYCQNIFANNFKITNLRINEPFGLVTAFELFEHLPSPISELNIILDNSESIFFSTVLQPKNKFKNSSEWWYFIPETGQHVSFYSLKSLKYIAKKYNLNLYTNKRHLHILTKRKFLFNPLIFISIVYYAKLFIKKYVTNTNSLSLHDYKIASVNLFKK